MDFNNDIYVDVDKDDPDGFYARIPYQFLSKVHKVGGKWMQGKKLWRFPIDDNIWERFEREFSEQSLHISDEYKIAVFKRRHRLSKFRDAKKIAMADEPIDFGVEGIELNGGNPLFNYQKHGVKCGLSAGDGFLIGDTMGLGKSIQSMAMAIERKNRGEINSCLIVCPASLKYNWLDEISKFSREKALVIGHKAKNKEDREKQWIAQGYFFKIVNYELVARDLYAAPKKTDNRIASHKMVAKSYDAIIFDECFSYQSRVLLPDGSQRYIGDIVTHNIPCDVLSFNFKKQCFESKPIINWFSNGKKKLVRIKTQYGTVKTTENHKYYDLNGNIILAGQLKKGDKIAVYNKFGFGNEQIPLLAGTLLGDGSLGKFSDSSRARLRTTHGKIQQEYAKWKEFVFGNSSGGLFENRGFGKESYCFRTKSVYPNHIYNIFYKNNKKTVTEEWLNCLNEFGLALWYMDDGYTQTITYTKKNVQKILDNKEYILKHKQEYLLSRKNPSYLKKQKLKKITSGLTKEFLDIISSENLEECAKKRLQTKSYLCHVYTNDFSKEEVYLVSSYLKRKWGLDNSVSWAKNRNGKNNDYYTIIFNRKSSIKLLNIISKYVPECMRYKLCGIGSDYDDAAVRNQIKNNGLFETEIISVEDAGCDYTYNIEVEDNHNYVCGGSLVSNCQYLKHHSSQRTQAARQLQAKYRIGLTGTPLDGRLEEIHSIFQILKPGLFVNKQKFMERYAEYDWFGAVKGYHRIDEVRQKIEPYYLRRLKEQVLKDLPPKLFKDMRVELSDKNMRDYKKLVKGKMSITDEKSAAEILIRARQFLDFPEIVGMHNASDKYAVFKELVDELVKMNNEKIIVFSQYTTTIGYIVKNLSPEYKNIQVIDGSVNPEERMNICRRFNNEDKYKILVMSDAGCTGLNLQAASAVIHYTDNFSPSVMQQRNDRAHRATTRHSVTIYRFITNDTIEEHVRDVLARKMIVNNALLDENCDEFALGDMSALELMSCL